MKGLRDIVNANRRGERAGIPSWCTAHPETLRAVLSAHADGDGPILIEATCNQVNQFGGYTGMRPAGFRDFVNGLARGAGVDLGRIILGGDHLGPNPWRNQSAESAMAKAADMVRAYAEAGFSKIHLDASMRCADDGSLSQDEMAKRAADLCAIAEQAGGPEKLYVIGTEVPIPGGETAVLDTLAVTRPEAAEHTLELHRRAFAARGLGDAFGRVIATVVQPGVDFGNRQIFAFEAGKAASLGGALSGWPHVAFEAHSTDYQSGGALAGLVAARFAILKVGPELTFAYREAVVAMAAIEKHLAAAPKSQVLQVIADVMRADPKHWKGYIAEDDRVEAMKIFGLSDRIRYYWPEPRLQQALAILYRNIDGAADEPGLISQFAGLPPGKRDTGQPLSRQIVQWKVGEVARKYLSACGLI